MDYDRWQALKKIQPHKPLLVWDSSRKRTYIRARHGKLTLKHLINEMINSRKNYNGI